MILSSSLRCKLKTSVENSFQVICFQNTMSVWNICLDTLKESFGLKYSKIITFSFRRKFFAFIIIDVLHCNPCIQLTAFENLRAICFISFTATTLTNTWFVQVYAQRLKTFSPFKIPIVPLDLYSAYQTFYYLFNFCDAKRIL